MYKNQKIETELLDFLQSPLSVKNFSHWISYFVFLLLCCAALMIATESFAQQATKQSSLPPCPGEYKWSGIGIFKDSDQRWHNCFGQAVLPERTYLGEWKNGRPDGQGLIWGDKKLPEGTYILGRWAGYRLLEGPAINFKADGSIVESGNVRNSQLTHQNVYQVMDQFDVRLIAMLTAAENKLSESTGPDVDILLLVKSNSQAFKFVSTLEGTKRLINSQELERSGVNFCIVKSVNQKHSFNDDVSLDQISKAIAQNYLNSLTGSRSIKLNDRNCVVRRPPRNGVQERFHETLDREPELLLTIRRNLPLLDSVSRGSSVGVSGYEIVQEIKFASFLALGEQIREAEKRRQQQIAEIESRRQKTSFDRMTELDSLANSRSTEKVGSIAFGTPKRSEEATFCTLTYDDELAPAIISYAQRGYTTQTEAFRTDAEHKK